MHGVLLSKQQRQEQMELWDITCHLTGMPSQAGQLRPYSCYILSWMEEITLRLHGCEALFAKKEVIHAYSVPAVDI